MSRPKSELGLPGAGQHKEEAEAEKRVLCLGTTFLLFSPQPGGKFRCVCVWVSDDQGYKNELETEARFQRTNVCY